MRSINRGKRPRGSKGSIKRGYIGFRDGPAPRRQIYKDKYCSYKRAEFYEDNICWVIDGSYGNCSSFDRPFSPSFLVLQQHEPLGSLPLGPAQARGNFCLCATPVRRYCFTPSVIYPFLRALASRGPWLYYGNSMPDKSTSAGVE